MKIFITQQCESLTGSLSKKFGYHIERRKNGFFSKRSQRANVPPDGHIRFIFACAELAHRHLQVSDILVPWTELYDALYEASHFIAALKVLHNGGLTEKKLSYNAADILNLKTLFGL